MTPQETFEKGLTFKLEGNEHFQKGEYTEALTKYYYAILHLRTVGGNQQKQKFEEESNVQQALIFNNMAAVHLKQENWKRAKENAKKSLELGPSNSKAKFRLAQAYLQLNELDNAETLLNQVHKQNPDDAAVKKELAILKGKSKSESGKERMIYQKMMAKMAQDDKT